ncbi:MAG TPA: four helix bundle protein [Bacteroidia bacterium]|nr:four helix bundle protein [Bacteroidia bacterium]
MATITRFEDIAAWQRARTLSRRIFELTREGDFTRDFKLRDQINGASGSVMDNISEGFERDGKFEFRQFLSIAKGSCGEVRSQLYRALDRKYITQETFNELYKEAENIGKMLASLMRYMNTTEHRGLKFKEPETIYKRAEDEKLVLSEEINSLEWHAETF